ncbi:MAG: hypothetical protein JNK35_09140 [Phycisphaerae bacterium]|nr:hypothetical protein [Phycisphaerae bacterium]
MLAILAMMMLAQAPVTSAGAFDRFAAWYDARAGTAGGVEVSYEGTSANYRGLVAVDTMTGAWYKCEFNGIWGREPDGTCFAGTLNPPILETRPPAAIPWINAVSGRLPVALLVEARRTPNAFVDFVEEPNRSVVLLLRNPHEPVTPDRNAFEVLVNPKGQIVTLREVGRTVSSWTYADAPSLLLGFPAPDVGTSPLRVTGVRDLATSAMLRTAVLARAKQVGTGELRRTILVPPPDKPRAGHPGPQELGMVKQSPDDQVGRTLLVAGTLLLLAVGTWMWRQRARSA